jgi:hypothetical protein
MMRKAVIANVMFPKCATTHKYDADTTKRKMVGLKELLGHICMRVDF